MLSQSRIPEAVIEYIDPEEQNHAFVLEFFVAVFTLKQLVW